MDEGTVRMVKGWYYQLPHNVQQSMASEMSGIYENGTIQAYLDAIQRHVPQKPERVEPCPLYCPYCPHRVEFTCSCETMRRLYAKRQLKSHRDPRSQGSQGNQENRAPHHHKSERNGTATHSVEKKTRFESPPAPRRCFKCDAPDWTPAHKCKGRSVSNAILEKPNLPEVVGIWERDDLELSEESGIITSAISARENLARSRPAIDLVLNGRLFKGLFVDTMSDFSVLRADLLAELRKGSKRVAVRSDNAPNVMTANGSSMNLAGVVELPVKFGKTEFRHQFLVSRDLPSPITALLGNDILPKIGIQLAGLEGSNSSGTNNPAAPSLVASVVETSAEADCQDLDLSLEDAISNLMVADKKDQNYYDLFYTYRLRVMEELQDDFKVNQQLTGFCTHPNAEIRFSTIDEEPVNVRQYDLPYMHRSTVTDQIRSWLDNGIIERCSNNNASNNWKWNYYGGINENKLKKLASKILFPQFKKYVDQFKWSDKTKQIVYNDPKLLFHFIYAIWNGSGFFQKWSKKLNEDVANGLSNNQILQNQLNLRSISASGTDLSAGKMVRLFNSPEFDQKIIDKKKILIVIPLLILIGGVYLLTKK